MNQLPQLSRGTGVPPPNPRLHWIETVEANASIRFRVWSPSIWELITHFNGRTKPCYQDHSLCEGGHEEDNLRWYGYIFGWHEPRNGPAFLQLTVGAARKWLAQVAPGCSLRGMIITVSRGRSKQGPQLLKVDKYCNTATDQLGRDCDPTESCYRLWKVKSAAAAFNLSLVTADGQIPDDVADDGCLKTDSSALSIMEEKSVSSRKRRSKKPESKSESA